MEAIIIERLDIKGKLINECKSCRHSCGDIIGELGFQIREMHLKELQTQSIGNTLIKNTDCLWK
jgi:hypothetical protein